jgi:predicted transcriptional regulator
VFLPDVSEIIALRKKMGLSQRKLAKMAGLSVAWINQVETGRIDDPSYAKLKKIADLYEKKKGGKGWTAGDICTRKILSAELGQPLEKANAKMIKLGISQLPVFDNDVCVGMITDHTISRIVGTDASKIKINKKMLEPPPPTIDESTPAMSLSEILEFFDSVLVEKNGMIVGILVPQDLNQLLAVQKEE